MIKAGQEPKTCKFRKIFILSIGKALISLGVGRCITKANMGVARAIHNSSMLIPSHALATPMFSVIIPSPPHKKSVLYLWSDCLICIQATRVARYEHPIHYGIFTHTCPWAHFCCRYKLYFTQHVSMYENRHYYEGNHIAPFQRLVLNYMYW